MADEILYQILDRLSSPFLVSRLTTLPGSFMHNVMLKGRAVLLEHFSFLHNNAPAACFRGNYRTLIKNCRMGNSIKEGWMSAKVMAGIPTLGRGVEDQVQEMRWCVW